MKLYLIGSLRNPTTRELAGKLRERGWDVFDDWHAAGPEADDLWMQYEKERGRTYQEALQGHTAEHTFQYDLHHLLNCDAGLLVAPAGKSAHLELGFLRGKGKPAYIYIPTEPERWDVMVKFATEVFFTEEELLDGLR